MQLSKNFSLEELTKSQIAIRNGIPNMPSDSEIANLRLLTINVLQPIRDRHGVVNVSSAYRSFTVNSLTGGAVGSDHIEGKAADIECPALSNYELAKWIAKNLKFKQLILEFHDESIPDSGWVHVSYDFNNLKQECLRAVKDNKGKTLYSSLSFD